METVRSRTRLTATVAPPGGTVPPIFTPKMFEKQGGMLAFFHPSGGAEPTFSSRFWCHFPSRGYPWSLPDLRQYPSGVPGRFLYGFLASRGRPWDSFWALWAPSGLPWGDLGRHFGAKSWHKRVKKKASGAHYVPESILSAKREGPSQILMFLHRAAFVATASKSDA